MHAVYTLFSIEFGFSCLHLLTERFPPALSQVVTAQEKRILMKTWGLSAAAACEAWEAGMYPGLGMVNLTLLEAHSVLGAYAVT